MLQRSCRAWTSRLYYAEEVFVSCALAALANVPPIRGSCTPLALAVIMLTAAHVAFQAVFHPYKELIDTGFSLAAGVLQVLLAIVNFALVNGAGAVAEDVAGVLVVALSSLFFVQAVVGSFVACAEQSRRRVAKYASNCESQHCDVDGYDADECRGALSVPLSTNPLAHEGKATS